jgi:transcriptional regulator with XRE-family HTH domain
MIGICEILVKKRKEKKLTQKELSMIAGVSNVQICTYETGKVIPSKIVASKIAVALDLPKDFFDDFFESFSAPSIENLHQQFVEFLNLAPIPADRFCASQMIRSLAHRYRTDSKALLTEY